MAEISRFRRMGGGYRDVLAVLQMHIGMRGADAVCGYDIQEQ